ncbi:MarR family winged helix-turn-helix transcriptional regulator [Actinomadura alba]|uniref:Winged helix-turn-helix transcriptional regulator n=1 Tax=Actinomadura alba TaxID=406431 RepID=A0ABR7LIH3_9ACTN|nr:MarR family winged helix-turn-helix transcriptional regulator [Actinomadura alba]MBC6464627.1 winged helix-turn-helix transcriptional regulator [Actinomadura alba]
MISNDDGCGELLVQLSATSMVIKRIKGELPPGSPGAGLSVMRTLSQCGEMRVSELSERFGTDQSVMSRHVADLEERGLVERTPNPHDRRSSYLRLTPDGEQAAEEAFALARGVLAETLHDWTGDEIAELTRLLARLRTSFDARRPSAAPVSRTTVGAKGN